MRGQLILILLFGFTTLQCFSQNPSWTSIKGKVVDQNQDPIPYVNISLRNDLSFGTYSNTNGEFDIRFPASTVNDTLIFSCMGYSSTKILLEISPVTDSLVVVLQAKIYTLNEVVISPDTALSIVRKSVEMLEFNLADNKSILQGFFREIIRSDYTYDRLVEAAVDVFDKGYKPSEDDDALQFKIREIRKSNDFIDLDWKASIFEYLFPKNGLHGHSESIFYNDYIRNHKVYGNILLNAPLGEDFFKEVSLNIDSVTYNDAEQILCIGISPKDTSNGLWPYGSLHIRSRDYAILQMSYETRVDPNVKNFTMIVPGQKFIHKTLIKYKEYNGKLYLSLLYRKAFRFQMNYSKRDESKSKGKLEGNFSHELLFITNEIITERDKIQRFRKKERQSKNIDLYSETWKYNEDFWKKYNAVNERPLDPRVKKDIERETSIHDQFKNNN